MMIDKAQPEIAKREYRAARLSNMSLKNARGRRRTDGAALQ